MEAIIIEGSAKTPSLNFDAGTGIFRIAGRSIPETAGDVYRPILTWLDEYALDPRENTRLDILFEYINTSSSKFIFEILKAMKKMSDSGNDVTVNWYHEEDDEDMMETGEDFQDVIDLPINIIEVEEF